MKKVLGFIFCATMISAQGMNSTDGGFREVFKTLGLTPENMLGDMMAQAEKQARAIGDDIARNLEEGDKVEAYEEVIRQLREPEEKTV